MMRARNGKEALKKALLYGKSESFEDSRNGRRIFFDFIGVIDMIDTVFFDATQNPTETWWEYREMVRPSERKRKLLVLAKDMRAFNIGTKGRGKLSVYGEPRR